MIENRFASPYNIDMSEIDKKKLVEVIDACIDASVRLHHIEIVIKGMCTNLQNEIDEISTKLYFHYKDDDEKEDDE